MDAHVITSVEDLARFYPQPTEPIKNKAMDRLDEEDRKFLEASPFVLLATSGEAGADCSPKGDSPGFVGVSDDGKTLHIPDRAGNNRLDSLRNIVENPNVGLLFLIPGISQTLRVNGRAEVSVEPSLIARFVVEGKRPRSVIVVSVIEAYGHCARALLQSDIWNPKKWPENTPRRPCEGSS